jgi:hypothetical protein
VVEGDRAEMLQCVVGGYVARGPDVLERLHRRYLQSKLRIEEASRLRKSAA